MKIVIPDDYQHAVQALNCFQLLAGFAVQLYHDTVTDIEELARRLAEADALVLTRERTRITEGRPGRAALDVFEQEPIYDSTYWALTNPKVLCTPHLGYVETGSYEYYFGVAFQNVVDFFDGRPQNVLNPEVLG